MDVSSTGTSTTPGPACAPGTILALGPQVRHSNGPDLHHLASYSVTSDMPLAMPVAPVDEQHVLPPFISIPFPCRNMSLERRSRSVALGVIQINAPPLPSWTPPPLGLVCTRCDSLGSCLSCPRCRRPRRLALVHLPPLQVLRSGPQSRGPHGCNHVISPLDRNAAIMTSFLPYRSVRSRVLAWRARGCIP